MQDNMDTKNLVPFENCLILSRNQRVVIHSGPGSSKQSPIKLTQDKREFWFQFCNFFLSFSVNIVWPSVFSLNTLLHQIFAKRSFRNFGVRTWHINSAIWRKFCTLDHFIIITRRNKVFINWLEIIWQHCKWFESKSISSSYSKIVRVRVVLKRTVVADWRFDNLSGSHLQSQVNSVCQSMVRWC